MCVYRNYTYRTVPPSPSPGMFAGSVHDVNRGGWGRRRTAPTTAAHLAD